MFPVVVILISGCLFGCGPNDREAASAVLLAAPLVFVLSQLILRGFLWLWSRVNPALEMRWKPSAIALGILLLLLVAVIVATAAQPDFMTLGNTTKRGPDPYRWFPTALGAFGASYLAVQLLCWRVWLFIRPASAFTFAFLPVLILMLLPALPMAFIPTQTWIKVMIGLWAMPGYWGIVPAIFLVVLLGEWFVRWIVSGKSRLRPPGRPGPAPTAVDEAGRASMGAERAGLPGKSEAAPSYLYGVHASEQERLEALAGLLGGAGFLPPLKAGSSILEVGCGTGAIARQVAVQVEPGEVVGLDREAPQLARAREIASRYGLSNLGFIHGEASRLDFPDGHFDGAYCRFLLEHVDSAAQVVREMARVVKPGGWVCAYEWQNSSTALHPRCPAVAEVWQAIFRLQDMMGGDSAVAVKVPQVFQQAGLKQVEVEAPSFTFSARDKERLEVYINGAREIIGQTRAHLLAHQLVPEPVLSRAEREYRELLESADTLVLEVMLRVCAVVR